MFFYLFAVPRCTKYSYVASRIYRRLFLNVAKLSNARRHAQSRFTSSSLNLSPSLSSRHKHANARFSISATLIEKLDVYACSVYESHFKRDNQSGGFELRVLRARRMAREMLRKRRSCCTYYNTSTRSSAETWSFPNRSKTFYVV